MREVDQAWAGWAEPGWVGRVAEANTRQVSFLPNDMTLSLLCQPALSRQVKVNSAEPSRLADELEGCAYA
jgi:hypothetical protein